MTGSLSQIFTHLICAGRHTGNWILGWFFLYAPCRIDLHSPSCVGQERLNIKDYCLWVTRSSTQLQVRRRHFTGSNLVKILPVLVGSGFIKDMGEQFDPGRLPKSRLINKAAISQFHKCCTLAMSAFLVLG